MRVSRQHARIRLENGTWAIEDLGSNNGTYVNGQRIQAAVLRDQDEIRIAHNTLSVEIPEDTASHEGPVFDANVTIVDLTNPRIIHSQDPSSSGLWQLSSDLAGVQDLQRQQRLLERKLIALGSILETSGQTTNPREMLASLCEQLLEVFPQADSVGVLVEDERSGELKVQTHRSRSQDELFGGEIEVPSTIINHVINDQRGILLQETATGGRRSQGGAGGRSEDPAGSRMGAPIRVHDHNYGVIYVECDQREFHQEDVDLLASIAAQAGLAIHSARMQQELHRQQRLERDLRVARQIQRSLLPPKPPDVVGLQFAVHYEPAYQIGGDFYDFIWHDREHLALVAGDVSGKAISAALYMARLTSELRSRASIAGTPARLLRRVNQEMLRLGDDGMFATLIYAVYDLSDRSLVFSNAGHVVPLLRRQGRVFALEAESAHVAPLGVIGDMEIGEARVQLQSGDLLVLTTDGIHEARDPSGNEYGAGRLMRRIETVRGGPEEVVKAILRDVDAHVGSGNQIDDMTIVAMTTTPARARRRTTNPGAETIPDGAPDSSDREAVSMDHTSCP
jgi:serine phosphatase RsbU (regulator of sigma subunit)